VIVENVATVLYALMVAGQNDKRGVSTSKLTGRACKPLTPTPQQGRKSKGPKMHIQ